MEAASKDTATSTARNRRAKRVYMILGVVALVVAGGWFVRRWWVAGKESTDDAQVEADVVPIAARVGGVLTSALVHDNQLVHADEKLFEIDPADLDVEVARAEEELIGAKAQRDVADAQVAIVEKSSTGGLSSARAALAGASASVRGASDSVRAAEASVERAKSDLATAEAELARETQLFGKEAITRRDLEHAQQVRDVAKAAIDAAAAQLDAAREQRGLAQSRVAEAEGHVTQLTPVEQQKLSAAAAAKLAGARVKSAEVAVTRARLYRSYATVRAPFTGVISRLGAHAGQSVMPGQTLLMLVPLETYVVANFKEHQIGSMKPGDPVDVKLDAYGGSFHGIVDTISPATGSRFSLIPPDNSTGNFVKVVQRVPVKITWTKPPTVPMRPGLSAEVTVHVGTEP